MFNSPEEEKENSEKNPTNFALCPKVFLPIVNVAANMNAEELELRICLARIGLNVRQCKAIVAEGFGSMDDLGEMLLKDVWNVCATISKLPANRGGVRIGYALMRRLKGFVWWIKDHSRRGQGIDLADWDLQVCKDSTDYMDMEDARADDSTKIEPPGNPRMAIGSNGSSSSLTTFKISWGPAVFR